MRPLLKPLQIGGVVGFAGMLAASRVIGAMADDASPSAFAAVRQSIAVAATSDRYGDGAMHEAAHRQVRFAADGRR